MQLSLKGATRCDSYFMLFGVGVSCRILYSIVSYLYMKAVANLLPRLGKRELICLLSFTCTNVVSVRRGVSSFSWCLGWAALCLSWHSLGLPYN